MTALLMMILRKMKKNIWLEIGLLGGLILSVALTSSIPLYANAVSHKMLTGELTQRQQESGQSSGLFEVSSTMLTTTTHEQLENADRRIDSVLNSFGIPALHQVKVRESITLALSKAGEAKSSGTQIKRQGKLGAMSGLEAEIDIISGRYPAPTGVKGQVEVIVLESLLGDLEVELGQRLRLDDERSGMSVQAEVVGVFRNKKSHYWLNNLSTYVNTFFMDFNEFEQSMRDTWLPNLRFASWYVVLDYSQMTSANISAYSAAYRDMLRVVQTEEIMGTPLIRAVAQDSVASYLKKERQLSIMMGSLNIPIIAMLLIYLYMVSQLIVDRQQSEIAVMRSRGASRLQIILSYVFELGVLGAIALLVGPLLGELLTRALGASNGFMSFVQRDALKVTINQEVYLYAGISMFCALILTLIPVIAAARMSIVVQKRQTSRGAKAMLWHRLYLDVLLLAASGYGLFIFRRELSSMSDKAIVASALEIDPMLFIVPSLFAIGSALLLLRFYPLFIRLIFWLGRSFWPPALYASLIQIGRSGTQYQFFMLFLILTVSTGMFSAGAARTINQNYEDKVRYTNGADLIVSTYWDSNLIPTMDGTPPSPPPGERAQFREPPFTPFEELSQVESLAKVFRRPTVEYYAGNQKSTATLLGIDTKDFGETTWFRSDLLERHLNEYLNLIAGEPRAVLVSRSMADQYDLKPGDPIQVGWQFVDYRPFIVYGIIDYFPTFNPNPQRSTRSTTPEMPHLIVGHLWVIQSAMALEPYQVWIKLKDGADRATLYDEMQQKGIKVAQIVDTEQDLVKMKNDPLMLGINGTMSLGFLMALIISFSGFLLYWVLSMRKRILQIGVFRALGLTVKQLISMLAAEQLLTSGAAIGLGAMSGFAATYLFVPFFQLSFDVSALVPPFRITIATQDVNLLFVFVTITVLIGLTVLSTILSKVKIHQALKLGED